ncbi:MAG: LamG-like jellyroll fold domain-containing protein [Candidatus Humimicrobiaceae bacterium]
MAIPSYLPQQANIKALYRLEDVNDDSGNAHTLTNVNSVTFTPALIRNGANLGASNSTKTLTHADAFGIASTTAITINFWVKLLAEIASGTWWLALLNSPTDYVGNVITYEYNAGTRRIAFNRVKYSVSDNFQYYNIALGTTAWHMLTYTWNTTNLVGYVDANAIAPLGTTGNGTGGSSNSFNIGSNGSTYFASALFDECVIWDKALTAGEVSTCYTSYTKPFQGGFSGVSNHWVFIKDMWDKHNKLWKPKGLILPKDLSFQF